MEKFVITGGKPLHGEVTISGAKNAAVGILPATILAADVCVIENLPDISDVAVSLKILSTLGAGIKMLFIHGDADDYVPTRMVYPLYEAKPGDKELWVVPGASHANSYRDNREEYTRRVGEFVGRYVGNDPE